MHITKKASLWTKLWSNTDGAAAIEYALIAVLVAIGALAGFYALGDSLSGLFSYVSNEASTTINSSTTTP